MIVQYRRVAPRAKCEPLLAFDNIRDLRADKVDMYDSLPDSDAVLAQFSRLMQELLRGTITRNTFRAWEIDLLLDIENCKLRESAKREALKCYQKAVQRQM